VLLGLVALVLVAGGAALIASGGSSGPSSRSTTASARGGSNPAAGLRASGTLSPVLPAPALALRNYLGQPVNIASYRGKALLVTFLYTNCPDICPLMTANLHAAQTVMGPKLASKAQIVAVSVDPKGDTRKSIGDFLARHHMTGRMQYLVGTPKELAAVWQAWGVGSEKDASQPQFINHSGLIYGVTASGKRVAVYASNFKPSDVAHDVPLLAAR
jgi:protein SCO1/2